MAYLRDPEAAPSAAPAQETFARLIAAGVAPDRLYEAVCTLRIELVLTAHPTEVARRTLIQHSTTASPTCSPPATAAT